MSETQRTINGLREIVRFRPDILPLDRKMIAEAADEIHRLLAALATAEAERDAAHNEALEKAAITDALLERQYRAGVMAGWNVANSDNPDEGYAAMMKYNGYLKPIIDRKRALKKETPNADK